MVDRLAREVDDGVEPLQRRRIELSVRGTPLDVARTDGRSPADDPTHLVAVRSEEGYERGADKSGGAGDGGLDGGHRVIESDWVIGPARELGQPMM
jgi:hypothetical protein